MRIHKSKQESKKKKETFSFFLGRERDFFLFSDFLVFFYEFSPQLFCQPRQNTTINTISDNSSSNKKYFASHYSFVSTKTINISILVENKEEIHTFNIKAS